MFASCLSPSWTPSMWLRPPLRSTLLRIGPMWACSAAWAHPSMTAWLCPSFLPHVITFTAEGDPTGSFELQLELRRAIVPFVSCKPVLLRRFQLFETLRPDRSLSVLHESPRYRWNSPNNRNKIATFAAWPVDTRRCPPGTACWSSLSSFETLSRTRYDLLQVIEPHRPFCFVDHTLVLSVFLLPRLAFRRRCFPTTWTAMRGLCLGLRLFFAYSRSLCSQARWRFSLTCSRWFDALLWS